MGCKLDRPLGQAGAGYLVEDRSFLYYTKFGVDNGGSGSTGNNNSIELQEGINKEGKGVIGVQTRRVE